LCVPVLTGDGVRNAGQPCFGPLNGGSHVVLGGLVVRQASCKRTASHGL
jgi:hypothetical protein